METHYDASSTALGAVLMQNGNPVKHSSRILNGLETRLKAVTSANLTANEANGQMLEESDPSQSSVHDRPWLGRPVSASNSKHYYNILQIIIREPLGS
ncbi:hypothetical protein RRG08_006611 [Elysia crispata]|uniref:Uncharacterized protein n=1 Tax=Elysia crispata TaxID=231223 RepID=A0AAE0YVV6_9GAST|nr:hypothetical protein RRG08_006611 [Elysia crispata]